ncbi:protein involved in gliding motility GldH [Gillisia mitskevichiae]|uniref:Protein involved in gliding motility GldH n=1 Tax=Gillisia mitskevichiae TaxID=270921 RepID=A0A495PZ68_9FLAO|nr:gliding motility lipoprotein GldH [Gillisia mitskevichiae]RKS55450.1 protein involved in gliding motility GldH [Gillisia mitskevichiae]
MPRTFLLILLLVTFFIGCDKDRVFDEYKSLPNEWNKDSVLTFTLKNIDTLQSYNLFINVRNSTDFEYSNLFLIAEIQFPQGKVVTDTLEYEMAAPNGKWLGTGFGDLKESKLWYKEQVQFPESGKYRVSVQHAMRKNGNEKGIQNLKGITEIGFRIEKILN